MKTTIAMQWYDWWGFCAGHIGVGFALAGDRRSEPNVLELLRDKARQVGAVFILGDVEDGVADRYLFNKLPEGAGTIDCPGEDYSLGYQLSPYYYNKNSGNMCRHLSVYKLYTEEAIDNHRDGMEEDEYDY